MFYGKQVISYILDLFYGARQYPCGWIKPTVVNGYFSNDKKGRFQQMFFDELLRSGFKKTYWQLIFPNQTAGLIKKISPTVEGVDEYHIRFYSDGVIDCELEVNRFNNKHWTGPRRTGIDLLENILDNEMNKLSIKNKKEIRKQFGMKSYAETCVRK